MPRSDLTNIHPASTTRHEHDSNPADWADNDDWDYEYDEEETEDFYLTLDLTTHLPDALVKRESAANGKQVKGILDLRLKEFKRMPRPSVDQSPGRLQDEENGAQDEVLDNDAATPQPQDEQEPSTPAREPAKKTESDKIQLIGLHTTNPYIMFNNKFYSTYWLTDISSQIWVTRPGVTDTKVYSGHLLDVVGMSRVRLLAKPAKITPRYDTAPPRTHSSNVAMPVQSGDAPMVEVDYDEARGPQQVVVPTENLTDPAHRKHAEFMERFSAIKMQKGERDQVPLYAVKTYEYPANAADIRARAWEEEDAARAERGEEDDEDMQNQPGRSTGQPGSKRRAATKRGKQAVRFEETESDADDDMDDATPRSEDASAGGTPDPSIAYDETTQVLKRGPKKRSAKLAALGLVAPEAEPAPKVKRTRRTKAQMAEFRAAEAAAKAAKAAEMQFL